MVKVLNVKGHEYGHIMIKHAVLNENDKATKSGDDWFISEIDLKDFLARHPEAKVFVEPTW